jgi:hypothetical protein
MLIRMRKQTFGSVPQNYKNSLSKFDENLRLKKLIADSTADRKETLKSNLNKT